MTTKKLR
jgi:hypothetical protein